MKTRLASLLLLSVTLTACGTSPDPGFYTLSPVDGPQNAAVTDTVNVGRPEIAGFLDRPDFVSQNGPADLNINETANWAEPLDEMVERVLAADLQQRLPQATIQTDLADETRAPRFIVETNLQQFNPANGRATLTATLTLTDHAAKQQPAPLPVNLTAETSSSPASVADSLSDLLGRYADRIAAELAAPPALNR